MHASIITRYPTLVAQKLNRFFICVILGGGLLAFPIVVTQAGGGVVLDDDVCIIWIDFYSAHFTAYQPDSSGNEQFCEDLPDTGETIFVLDYLHNSLKEVPVDFRIIRDVTGLGRYAKLEQVQALEDIEEQTVFYQPPVVRPDASFKIEHDFTEEGAYIGIVSAGHPTNDSTYTAVFPFEVGARDFSYLFPLILLLAAGGYVFLRRSARSGTVSNEQGVRQ
jgi:hypothetical protein